MIYNRYWISDSSGLGYEKWQYFEGNFEGMDETEIRLYVEETYERWAAWTHYSFGYELNVTPPVEFLQKELASYERRQQALTPVIESIKNLIKERQ